MDCLMLHRAPENEKTRGVRITSERRRIELLHGMGLGCIGGFCGCLRSGKHPPEESGGSMGRSGGGGNQLRSNFHDVRQ